MFQQMMPLSIWIFDVLDSDVSLWNLVAIFLTLYLVLLKFIFFSFLKAPVNMPSRVSVFAHCAGPFEAGIICISFWEIF